jgi:hypothetical protein
MANATKTARSAIAETTKGSGSFFIRMKRERVDLSEKRFSIPHAHIAFIDKPNSGC